MLKNDIEEIKTVYEEEASEFNTIVNGALKAGFRFHPDTPTPYVAHSGMLCVVLVKYKKDEE